LIIGIIEQIDDQKPKKAQNPKLKIQNKFKTTQQTDERSKKLNVLP